MAPKPKSKTESAAAEAAAAAAKRQLGFSGLWEREESEAERAPLSSSPPPPAPPNSSTRAPAFVSAEPIGAAGGRIGAAFADAAALVTTSSAAGGAAELSARAGAAEAVVAPRVFGVSELVRAARLTLEGRFAEVRVEGEVSGFKRSGPGHFYFTLKDDQACVECVMYSREATKVRFNVENGMAVRLRGRLTIYEGRGRFQLTVVAIEPTGAGALAVAFEQLKQKLEAEGLFAQARKRPLPFLARRIGVVTSPQGAVIRDIIRVAHRRFPMAILLAPTPVQGPGAAASVVSALGRLACAPEVDVIIVARGGGSIDDLWCFNEEAVARAIAACPIPVISAIGHETDFTIADFVADVRAATPSAAAELATPVLADLHAELLQWRHRGARAMTAQLRQVRLLLERARTRVGDPRRLFGERRQRLDDLVARGHRAVLRRFVQRRAELTTAHVAISRAHPHRRIGTQRALLIAAQQALRAAMTTAVQRRRKRFDGLEDKLGALSPRRVLDRGYSLAFGGDGHLITDAADVREGAPVRVVLRRGELFTEVRGVRRSRADGDGDGEGTLAARGEGGEDGGGAAGSGRGPSGSATS